MMKIKKFLALILIISSFGCVGFSSDELNQSSIDNVDKLKSEIKEEKEVDSLEDQNQEDKSNQNDKLIDDETVSENESVDDNDANSTQENTKEVLNEEVDKSVPNEESVKDINKLVIDSTFDFKTTKKVELDIYTKDISNQVLKNVRLDIYYSPKNIESFSEVGDSDSFDNIAEIENELSKIESGITNSEGSFKASITVPSYIKNIIILTNYIGLPSEIIVPIENNKVSAQIGGGR